MPGKVEHPLSERDGPAALAGNPKRDSRKGRRFHREKFINQLVIGKERRVQKRGRR